MSLDDTQALRACRNPAETNLRLGQPTLPLPVPRKGLRKAIYWFRTARLLATLPSRLTGRGAFLGIPERST